MPCVCDDIFKLLQERDAQRCSTCDEIFELLQASAGQRSVPHETPKLAQMQGGARRMITEHQLLDILPFGRTTLFALIKEGHFPRGIFISRNRRVWFESDVAKWQAALEANPFYDHTRIRKGGRPRRLSTSNVKEKGA